MTRIPICPDCALQLSEHHACCGDDDPECLCDQFYKCAKCGDLFVESCEAHWSDYPSIRDPQWEPAR